MNRRRSTPLRAAPLVIAACSFIALAACGGGDAADSGPSDPPAASDADAADPQAAEPSANDGTSDATTSDGVANDDNAAGTDVEIPNGFPVDALVDGIVFKTSGNASFAEVSVRTSTEGQPTIDAALAAIEADGWTDAANKSILETEASPPFATGYITYAKDGATLRLTFKLNDVRDSENGEDFQVAKYTCEAN